MSTEAGKSGNLLVTVTKYAKIIFFNMGRRFLVWGRGILIWCQGRKFKKVCQGLGAQVFTSLEEGEVNPLLTDTVKDFLDKARAVKAVRDRHLEAQAALRQRMAEAWAGLRQEKPEKED
jgi:hypothetical protein